MYHPQTAHQTEAKLSAVLLMKTLSAVHHMHFFFCHTIKTDHWSKFVHIHQE
jgi:hypothetical protein